MTDIDNAQKNKYSPTIYDDAFRTIVEKCNRLIIPLINEMFNTSYDMDDKIISLNDTFIYATSDNERITTDAHLIIEDKNKHKHVYHLECQSNPNSNMSLRMIEYDLAIGLYHKTETKDSIRIKFPDSGVLWLRGESHSKKFEIDVQGNIVSYTPKTLKIKSYSKEDITEKQLYILLPFYILKFEKQLEKYESGSKDANELFDELNYIIDKLLINSKDNALSHYEQSEILEITQHLFDYSTCKFNSINKKGGAIMGGRLMELETDKIYDRGKLEGRAEGRAEGKAEGIAEGEIKGENNGILKTYINVLSVEFNNRKPSKTHFANSCKKYKIEGDLKNKLEAHFLNTPTQAQTH